MTVYSLIYIILSVILLLYSIRNRLDLLCIASVCYLVYTMYCIPGTGISGYYRPVLSHSLYYSVFTQLVIITSFVLIARYTIKHRNATQQTPLQEKGNDEDNNKNERLLKTAFRIYTLIIVAFAAMNIASVGLSGFMAGKSVVWEQTNVFYIVSLYGAWPSFAYGVHKKDMLVWIPSLLVELSIFFAGSRAFTATIIIIFLCERGTILWQKKKDFIMIYILGGIGVLFLLLYRKIDTFIMEGDINGALNALLRPQTWMEALEFNEPRVIIANYDYAFTSGMRFPIGDVVYRIIDFVPGLTSLVGIKLKYPEYYSSWLMDEVHASAGVGGSIWGESYAMMGFLGIIFFTIVWLVFINFCNKHLDYHSSYSYFIVSLGTYLAWYINRLDYNRVAQSFKVLLLCFLIWAIVYLFIGGTIIIGKYCIKLRNS